MNDEQNEQPDIVVSLEDARDEKKERRRRAETKMAKSQRNEHAIIGQDILNELKEQNLALMYADKRCWLYKNGLWGALDDDEERDWLSRKVEVHSGHRGIQSTTKIVNETRAWIKRHPDLFKESVDWDNHGMIATTGGLIDWRDDNDRPVRPEDYCTRLIDCANDADADCPIWERVLKEDYQLDDGTIRFLQEISGCSLIAKKPRTLMRALVLLGPSNSGKSNILNVLAGLISDVHNATELKLLENAHGLMAFLQPHPWVLHEAFDQSRWELSATVKALLSGDPVNVNIKNGPIVPLIFLQPIFWGANVAPQFREASRAMENRLAIVKMTRAFDPTRIIGTAAIARDAGHNSVADYILATEKAGVLNWAIEGLRRATERGHFEFTQDMLASLHAMRTSGNMAIGFIEACCIYDPDAYVTTADFYGAFRVWHQDHQGGQPVSMDSLGRAMSALADARVLTERIGSSNYGGGRVYAGIRLNDAGLDNWNAYSASQWAQQSGQRISERAEDVNRQLTAETASRPGFQAMRAAHAVQGS